MSILDVMSKAIYNDLINIAHLLQSGGRTQTMGHYLVITQRFFPPTKATMFDKLLDTKLQPNPGFKDLAGLGASNNPLRKQRNFLNRIWG